MNLIIERIDKNIEEHYLVDALNNEAFPVNERITTQNLIEMSKKGHIDFYAVYDSKLFIGFFIVFTHQKSAYLFYLAIEKKYRKQGYGKRVLKIISDCYTGYQIVLDIEEVHKKYPDHKQRSARKKFYLNHDYQETSYYIDYLDVTFEILFKGDKFDKNNYISLLKEIKPIVDNYRISPLKTFIYQK